MEHVTHEQLNQHLVEIKADLAKLKHHVHHGHEGVYPEHHDHP